MSIWTDHLDTPSFKPQVPKASKLQTNIVLRIVPCLSKFMIKIQYSSVVVSAIQITRAWKSRKSLHLEKFFLSSITFSEVSSVQSPWK